MRKTPKSKEEALKMAEKRQKKIADPSEDCLQANIVRQFSNKYPERRGQLFLVDNNADNVATMGKKLALGLVKGVSDLLLSDKGAMVGIELKTLNSRHKASHVIEQAEWILKWCGRGGFCTSVEMFWDMYYGKSNGIPPQKVIDYIKKEKISTVMFGNIK